MIEEILALVPVYGLWIVSATTYLSCLAVPVPASMVMLTAGAFVAAGDLPPVWTVALAWVGAVLGDQTGFAIGHRGGRLLERMSRNGKAAALIARARDLSDRHGGLGVFLSRWLLSPLGPYMNFATGAAGMNWARFTAWGAAGEAVWVAIYLGLGAVFAEQITAVAELAADFSGMLAAGAVTVGLGLWLRATLKAERAARRHDGDLRK